MLKAIGITLALFALIASGSKAQTVSHDASRNSGPGQAQNAPTPKLKPSELVAIEDAVNRLASAIETSTEKQNTSEEKEYAKRNLAAQEQLARWAFWAFVLATAEVLLTFVGLVFIWRTLKASWTSAAEAKRTADEAKRQADVAEKTFHRLEAPYIYPTNMRYFIEGGTIQESVSGRKTYIFSSTKGGMCVAACAKNYGRAPARMTGAKLRINIVGTDDVREKPVYSRMEEFHFNYMLGEKDISEPFKLGPLGDAVRYLSEIDERSKFLELIISVRYLDVFDQRGELSNLYHWDPKAQTFVFGSPFDLKWLKKKEGEKDEQ